MIAALIFRRQLVRHKLYSGQQALSASKLPLEKFHRLLDLECCYRFKISQFFIYSLLKDYIFFSCVYTGYYSDPVACGALKFWVSRPGGRAINPAPPPAHVFISRFLLCLVCLVCLNYCYLQERERHKFPALPPM